MLFFRKSVTFIKSLTCLMKKNSKNNSNNFLSSKWITLKSFIQQSSLITEAAVRGCFAKFTRKFLQNSQENARLSFLNKVAGLTLSLQLYYKMTLPQLFSRGFCKIFKGIYFHRTPRMAASVIKNKNPIQRYYLFLFNPTATS